MYPGRGIDLPLLSGIAPIHTQGTAEVKVLPQWTVDGNGAMSVEPLFRCSVCHSHPHVRRSGNSTTMHDVAWCGCGASIASGAGR